MLTSQDLVKIKKINLSGEDNCVLSQMYLPFIGVISFATYYLLNSIKEEETSVRRLVDVLGVSNINNFDLALKRLEGIGLLKRYQNKDKGYILEAIRPLSQKSFLNNSLLKEYLISQIGDVEVQQLVKNNNSKKYSGYEDVTLRFDEVYKTSKIKSKEIDPFVEAESDNIKIKNEDFDYLVFKLLVSDVIPEDVLNDEDFKNNIYTISYQYQLTVEEMKEAVNKAMVINKDLKFEDINTYAGYIYQNKGASKNLGFDYKEAVIYEHELTSEEENLIVLADNSSISKMLGSFSDGQASLAEINDYLKVAQITNLPTGVINILALYINQNKKGEIINLKYLEKVAINWKKAGVKTTADAVKYLRNQKDKKNNPRKKKVIEEPEWMKDAAKEEKKASELSKEEKAQLEKLYEDVFG